MPDQAATLVADLGALLDHLGERGVALTDTGRLRIADVRAINGQFADPAELDRELGAHTYRLRSEDDAWRVHFLRLAAHAAGLIDARRGRLRRTAHARAFERLSGDDAARELFVAWWWKGAWDMLPTIGGIPQLALLRDRAATASALLELGEMAYPLEALGGRVRTMLAPGAPTSTSFALGEEAWAYAAWHLCLEPLGVFAGSRAAHTVETIDGHSFEKLSAIGLTARGISLLRVALAQRPATPPRIRRGMRSPFPPPPSGFAEDVLARMVQDRDVAAPQLELPPARLAARDREELRRLPRVSGVWEGDLGEMPVIVAAQVPLCAIWLDSDEDVIRSVATKLDAEPGELVLASFVDAALRPKAGTPALPWRVRVHPEVASAVRPALAELGLVVEAVEDLPLAHGALDSLADFLRVPATRPHTKRPRR